MPAILFEVDPTSEDAANVPVVLTDTTWRVMEMDATAPEIEPQLAASAETEGDPLVGTRHKNRIVSLTLLAKAATDALTQTAVYGLMQKVDKLRREGGTLKWTTVAGTAVVADVLFAEGKSVETTIELYGKNQALKLTLDFTCRPYLRGAPVQLADHAETTLPAVVGVDTAVGGDAPAAVRMIIDEDQSQRQWWLVWGLQSRYYDSSANAALFYEAEGRTALAGSATAAGPSGASGSGSNVMRSAALRQSYTAILSTQATGGGAHLSHVGNYVVFARVQTPTANTGTVSVALEWSEGDFRRPNQNAGTSIPIDAWDGTWRLLELGQVTLTKVTQGVQRWEGRVLAQSTAAADTIDIDYLLLVPTTEGSGRVSALWSRSTPSVFIARDEFGQSSGALAGKTAPVGGTWAGAGDSDDFAVTTDPNGNHVLTRTALSDVSLTGRFAISGATATSDQLVQVDQYLSLGNPVGGANVAVAVVARYTNTSNYLIAQWLPYIAQPRLFVSKVVAGVGTTLGIFATPYYAPATWRTLQLYVDANGNWAAWFGTRGALTFEPLLAGQDSVLATAGALATGKPAFYEAWPTTYVVTRYYDNFAAWVPTADAAMFPGQSVELRSDQVNREDNLGVLWQRPSSYEGDYPVVPPAGAEGRSVRVVVKACRNDPTIMADAAIDDISYRLTVTPRYLVLPA